MQKLYFGFTIIAVLILSLPLSVNAQIWTEDFDGSNPTNPFDFSVCIIDDSRDYYGIVCLDGGPCGSDDINSDYTPGYIGATGSFFGARDINGDPCGTNSPVTSSATGINISSCPGATSLYICFDIAESDTPLREGSDTWDGNQSSATSNSFVTFSASIDGGADSDIISFAAMANNNSGPAVDADCDGVGEGAEVTSAFSKICAQIHTTGSAMDLSITIGGLNTDGDDVAIDNIEVHCGTPPSGMVVPSCTPFVPGGGGGATGTSIFLENFDGSNVTNLPTWSEMCSDDRDYFDVVCQNGAGCANEINSDFAFNGVSGSYFGIRDMDADPCSGSATKTLGFSGIDVSSCSGVSYVCFDVAESRNMGGAAGAEWSTSNSREDSWDSNSNVFVKASVDGAPFTNVTAIEAFENSDTRPGIDINCNGKALDSGEPELTDTFTKYCFELPTSGNSLDLEFEVNNLNTQGEDLALDNIEVFCGTPTSGTVLPACTPFVLDIALFHENFDGSNVSNPFSSTGCDATPSRDYLGIVCLDGYGCPNEINDDYLYSNATGQFFGVRDMDNVCSGSLAETITATGIDISSCSGAERLFLCFDIAESSPNFGRELNSSDGTEDTWDGNQSNSSTNTFVTFSARISGGTTFPVASFAAYANNNSGPGLDGDCDGTADGAPLSDAFQTFCFEIALQGSELDLDLSVGGMNTDGDDVAIDNITVFCTDDESQLPAALSVSCSAPGSVMVPTMGEWAIFILFLLIINMAAVFIIAMQNKLTLAMENQTVSFTSMLSSLPFEKSSFIRAMKHAFVIAMIGFVIIYLVWGEIISTDFIGMAISIPLISYFIHLFFTKE